MNTVIYPPTNESGNMALNRCDIPDTANMVDYNELYELWEDTNGDKYIYKKKHPKTPINRITGDEELSKKY